MAFKELLEKMEKKFNNDSDFKELKEAIKQDLETPLNQKSNEVIELQKKIDKNSGDFESLKTNHKENLDKYYELKVFSELDPSKIDIYKKAEQIITDGKIENIQELTGLRSENQTLQKQIDDLNKIKGDLETKNTELQGNYDNLDSTFKNHRLVSALTTKLANTNYNKNFSIDRIVEALKPEFENIVDKETKQERLSYKKSDYNAETKKARTFEESLSMLKDDGFGGYFGDSTSRGSESVDEKMTGTESEREKQISGYEAKFNEMRDIDI